MAKIYQTPGVYIEERSAFPNSAVPVATAVPAFIGYTEKAERQKKSLHLKPTKISSFGEYLQFFGGAPLTKIELMAPENSSTNYQLKIKEGYFTLHNQMKMFFSNGGTDCYIVSVGKYTNADGSFNTIQLAVDADPDNPDVNRGLKDGIQPLLKEMEPTMLVIPEAVHFASSETEAEEIYADLYTEMLLHCGFQMQNRFAITDVWMDTAEFEDPGYDMKKDLKRYRDKIGTNNLMWGAAYYPYLHTTAVSAAEVSLLNIANIGGESDVQPFNDDTFNAKGEISDKTSFISTFLTTTAAAAPADPAPAAPADPADPAAAAAAAAAPADPAPAPAAAAQPKSLLAILDESLNRDVLSGAAKKDFAIEVKSLFMKLGKAAGGPAAAAAPAPAAPAPADPAPADPADPAAAAPAEDTDPLDMNDENAVTEMNKSLIAVSTMYKSVLRDIRKRLNLLPASASMAGLYSMVDNQVGVFQSPANVSVGSVLAPAINISSDQQEDMNIPINGKAVNAIRTFPGKGVLVWGARTLDGNSQDWRYISVRRTVIYIEQSIKAAAEPYVFEPNTASTWSNMKAMLVNFLTNVWQSGALAGATPEDAFSVDVGLGSTMTPVDILDGYMRISVKIAVTRPAEFIVITFEQKMQQS